MSLGGYSYTTFCTNVQAIHGPACWIHRLLTHRDGGALPWGWLLCDGSMDGHHLVPKQVLKREFPHGAWLRAGATWAAAVPLEGQEEPEKWPHRSLAQILNDGRVGVPACRKHHDMIESKQLRICRDGLPVQAVEFATALGLGWYLDSRAFAPAPNGRTDGQQ